MKKILKKTWIIIKEMTTTFSGWLSLIITFLIMSGVGVLVIGFALGNTWLKGVGGTMLVLYFAPNGIMIFNIVVVAPLWNRYIFQDKRMIIKNNKDTTKEREVKIDGDN